jgi:predicted amidohydrolase
MLIARRWIWVTVLAVAGAGRAWCAPPSGGEKRVKPASRAMDIPATQPNAPRTQRIDTFLAAAVQVASEFGNPERNRQRLGDLVAQAARAGAQVVVLPEAAVTGYLSEDLKQTWRVGDRPVSGGLKGVDPHEAAEPVPGPSTRFFAKLAREHGVYLTVPLVEVDDQTGRYYNTVVLLGPDGETLIHYRKLNPWPWAEQGWATEGNLGRPVVDTPLGRLGVLICYDIHQQATELAKLKVNTLLYSIAWVDDEGSDWFPKRLPGIARSNSFNIVAANWTFSSDHPKPAWYGYGQSAVIDATGRVLARVEGDPVEGIAFATLPVPSSAGSNRTASQPAAK